MRSKMERAAGLAAARSIPQRLYYHRGTAGVKSERQRAVGATRVDKMGRVSCIDLLGWIFAPSYCSLAYSRFDLLEGRQPGIGVFPQRQKIFIRSQRPRPSDIGDGATEVLRFRARCWGAAVLGPYDGFALGTLRGKTRWPGGAEHAQPCKVKTAGRMPALPARDAGTFADTGAVPPQRTASYLARFGFDVDSPALLQDLDSPFGGHS